MALKDKAELVYLVDDYFTNLNFNATLSFLGVGSSVEFEVEAESDSIFSPYISATISPITFVIVERE